MFSNETLDHCTVIKISKVMPKKLIIVDPNSELRDQFLFVARDKSGLKVYMDLGFEPTPIEKETLKGFLKTWGGSENLKTDNTILEIEFPKFLVPFYENLSAIPGCRVSPNMLHSHGDVYLNIEFDKSVIRRVNDAVLDFLAKDHLFPKELIYSGPQNNGLPYLLRLYEKFGNHLGDFVLIKTVWEYDVDQIKAQNQGVLQNNGNYVPKQFSNEPFDFLIFRMYDFQIRGGAQYSVINPSKNLVEFQVKSSFFSDFFNEVIKRYTGPIFFHIEIKDEKQISYYLVDKKTHISFIKGIKEHWKKPARSDHVNYIEAVESLDEALNKMDLT